MENTELTPGARVVMALFGLLILGISIACFSGVTKSDDPAAVECGDQVMESEDTCVTWVNGEATERSLSEQEEQNDQENWGVIIGAVIGMIIGGGIFIAAFAADRDRSGSR